MTLVLDALCHTCVNIPVTISPCTIFTQRTERISLCGANTKLGSHGRSSLARPLQIAGEYFSHELADLYETNYAFCTWVKTRRTCYDRVTIRNVIRDKYLAARISPRANMRKKRLDISRFTHPAVFLPLALYLTDCCHQFL